jgi:FkbM family methyltransferase
MHRLAARHPGMARPYLRLFKAARLLPDASWKDYLLNSLQSVEWPDVGLPPARVALSPSIAASIVPHPGEFDFAAHLCRRITYESEVVSWLSGRQYDAVIEIGANVGIYTLLFSQMWPAARIFCFEPSRKAYRRLLENLALNESANVTSFNCAIAAQAGFLEFHEPEGHLTNGSIDKTFAALFSNSIRSTSVASLNGNDILQLIPGKRKVLLKIDVEGSEPVVVRSLENLIASVRPDVLIEVLPQTVDALNELDAFGAYRLYQLDTRGPRERNAFIAGSDRDYALVPAIAAAATIGMP